MFDYPVTIHEDENPGVAVTCDDLPEFNSAGDDVADALRESVDGIETALSIYVDQRRPIPPASQPTPGQFVVHLPAVTVAKIILWNEMMARDMRKADLCRLLGLAQTQGDRLVDFLHTSKMEAIENALAALNVRLQVNQLQLFNLVEVYEYQNHEPIILEDAWCSIEYTGVEEHTRNQIGWFNLPGDIGIPADRIGKITAKQNGFRNGDWVMATDLNRPDDLPHSSLGKIHLPVTFFKARVMGS
ncbi:type II toxin-antitoxin system HicB family antitoxin [Pseudomonas protegens]|uniref:type II toxin-antitoxin system HicB family antitoxin n=1 Tax=Pseudomonas protegens TaxID=380021 RepID=UPI00382C381E